MKPLLVDRAPDCAFDFEGVSVPAVTGEPVAVSLFAAGTRVLSRSIKYHRPRAFFCLAGHCGACLMRVEGQPNVKACRVPARAGLMVERQNAFPSGGFDVLGAADFFFPRGMDHHTMFTAPRALNVLMQKVVRQLGGLGRLPDAEPALAELPRGQRRCVDVAVIGGGPAGLAAAIAARRARPAASVLLVDEGDRPGGSLLAEPGGAAIATALTDEARAVGVELRAPASALAYYPEDEGGLLAVEERGALLRLHARRWVYATGGSDVNALFTNNDRPGILAARAVGTLLLRYGVLAGRRPVVLGDGDYARKLAEALAAAIGDAAAVRRVDNGEERLVGARGNTWVTGVDVASERTGKTSRVRCDVVAVATLPAPASELARQHGVAVRLDAAAGGFACVTDDNGATAVENVFACGDVRGYRGPAAARDDGARAGHAAAMSLP